MPRRVTRGDHEGRVVRGALANAIPTNVDCPARCKFCYEAKVSELVPGITTVFRPRYDTAAFERFETVQRQASPQRERLLGSRAERGGPGGAAALVDRGLPAFEKTASGITYYPNCDYFSLGLSNAQIEQIVRNKRDEPLWIYTTGLRVDPDFVAYLFRTYPDQVRVHLSIVSFDPAIRRDVMHPGIKPETLERICAACDQPTMFIIYFTPEQLQSDLDVTDRFARERNGRTYLHKLYYNRLEDPCVVGYSQAAEETFPGAVPALASRPDGAKTRIVCSPDPVIYAHRWRGELREMLSICEGTADEAVLCSEAALPVIEELLSDRLTRVRSVPSIFGGNVNFSQGMTVRAMLPRIEALMDAPPGLRRVLLPSSAFFVEGRFDLNGETVDAIRRTHPDLEVVVVDVPERILRSTVTVDDCVDYYRSVA